LHDAKLLCDIERVLIVISQPRLDHLDEYEFPVEDLIGFAYIAQKAIEDAGHAMVLGENSPDLNLYLHPQTHTCRWCRVKATCPKLGKVVMEEIRAEFDTIAAEPPPLPVNNEQLGKAAVAMPMVKLWCKAVESELWRAVSAKETVIGSDGEPYKIVEGNEGKRVWSDKAAAEAALLGQLPPEKAYKPQEIITAPAAEKILKKKATAALWTDLFVPLIERGKGKPQLVLGSDPRPPYSGAAGADEFDELDIMG
jgi:hypothetical protein